MSCAAAILEPTLRISLTTGDSNARGSPSIREYTDCETPGTGQFESYEEDPHSSSVCLVIQLVIVTDTIADLRLHVT